MRRGCLVALLLLLPASAQATVYQFESLACLDADPLEISVVSDNPDLINVNGYLFDGGFSVFSSGPSGFDSLEVNSSLSLSLIPAGFEPGSTTEISFLMNSGQFRLHSSPADIEIIGISIAGFHPCGRFSSCKAPSATRSWTPAASPSAASLPSPSPSPSAWRWSGWLSAGGGQEKDCGQLYRIRPGNIVHA
jgi:hypothetical protein